MSLANDSILVTPGSGATVATHAVSSKEHQVIMQATPSGQLIGSEDFWFFSTGNTAHVAAARTTLIDLFNASGSGKIIRVRGIFVIPALAAVTGVGQTYEVIRTSAVGTGGSTITGQTADTNNAALSGSVTARTKPTGGATTSATLLFLNGSSEETSPYASLASQLNRLPLVAGGVELVLREGQGIKVDQTTNSSVGNVNIVIVATQE